MLLYFLYAVIGKLFIYLIQIFPYKSKLKYLNKLVECDLCLGVWVYFAFALLFGSRVNLFSFLGDSMAMLIITSFITGSVTSFIVHLVSVGWDTKFRIVEIK